MCCGSFVSLFLFGWSLGASAFGALISAITSHSMFVSRSSEWWGIFAQSYSSAGLLQFFARAPRLCIFRSHVAPRCPPPPGAANLVLNGSNSLRSTTKQFPPPHLLLQLCACRFRFRLSRALRFLSTRRIRAKMSPASREDLWLEVRIWGAVSQRRRVRCVHRKSWPLAPRTFGVPAVMRCAIRRVCVRVVSMRVRRV